MNDILLMDLKHYQINPKIFLRNFLYDILFSGFQSAGRVGSTTTRAAGRRTTRDYTSIVYGAVVAETYSCAPNMGEIKFELVRLNGSNFYRVMHVIQNDEL